MATEKIQIHVGIKQQLKEARDGNDDWTGKKSAKERRKLQNRLHQRTWRRRKLEKAQSHLEQLKIVPPEHTQHTINREYDALESAFVAATASFIPETFSHSRGPSEPQKSDPLQNTQDINPSSATPVNLHSLMSLNLVQTKPPTARTLPQMISQKLILPLLPALPPATTYTILLPLSPDHRLITLIQYNVMRALLLNFHLCNILSTLPSSCEGLLALPPLPHTLPAKPPPSFAWTEVQKRVRHKDWIDTFPCPRMRDNLILAAGSSSLPPATTNSPSSSSSAFITTLLDGKTWESRRLFDEDELCSDSCGGLYEGFDDCATRGMLVWGDPWEVRNWEISEGFAKKWGWLLKGCREMIEATNYWRKTRGEEPIVVEV